MKCSNCGSELKDDAKICESCKKEVIIEDNPDGMVQPQENAEKEAQDKIVSQKINQIEKPPLYLKDYQPLINNSITGKPSTDSKYAVMSVGAYIGSFIIMGIPVIGWLICIIWACGGTKKVNRRNLARAMILLVLLSALIGFGIVMTTKSLFGFIKGEISKAMGVNVDELTVESVIKNYTGMDLNFDEFLKNFGLETMKLNGQEFNKIIPNIIDDDHQTSGEIPVQNSNIE